MARIKAHRMPRAAHNRLIKRDFSDIMRPITAAKSTNNKKKKPIAKSIQPSKYHPPYRAMIVRALRDAKANERRAPLSMVKILAFIRRKWNVPESTSSRHVINSLRWAEASGVIGRVKRSFYLKLKGLICDVIFGRI